MKAAADCIVSKGPSTQERWENPVGYSPASIAAEVAGLVCAAEIAERNGDDAAAQRYREVADERQRRHRRLDADDAPARCRPTRTTCARPSTASRTPARRTTTATTARRSTSAQVVDPSFLELARLGVKPADAPGILSTLPVVDRELGVDTPNGRFWHRYNYDGYGELPDGGPFGTAGNRGRLWPIFAGERGEYELLTGNRRARAGACARSPHRQQRPAAARAGVGRPAAARLHARHADLLGHAARLDPRAARAARVVARRGPPGRAAVSRRQALPLSHRARAVSVAARGRVAQPAHEA